MTTELKKIDDRVSLKISGELRDRIREIAEKRVRYKKHPTLEDGIIYLVSLVEKGE